MVISFSAEKLRFSSLVRNSKFTIYAQCTFFCLQDEFEFSYNIKHTVVTTDCGPAFLFKGD